MEMSQSLKIRMPKSIKFIVGNEAAERFSFYGMRGILVIFMTKYMMQSDGVTPDLMTGPEANVWFHWFASAVYFFPILGAIIADAFWGKYKTIINLSIVYCMGHFTLALFETRMGLAVGLTLIAIGSGGIKPCVSAFVGDQFTRENSSLLSEVYSWFYFSINFGSTFATLLIPWTLNAYGPSVAFGIPGLLMLLATIIIWMGKKQYTHVKPKGWEVLSKEVFSSQRIKTIFNLCTLYVFIAFFWSLFDQTASSWVQQAENMDKWIDLRWGPLQMDWLNFELFPSQIQTLNPILVMIFIPLFNIFFYPMAGKLVQVTPLRKIGFGFFVAGASFIAPAYVEHLIELGQTPSIIWHFWAYVIITAAEILISITALEFSYTQAPNSMKSIIMGFFLLSVTLGNSFTAIVNWFIQDESGQSTISGVDYYMFFVWLILGAGVVYIFVANRYKEKTYLQG